MIGLRFIICKKSLAVVTDVGLKFFFFFCCIKKLIGLKIDDYLLKSNVEKLHF